ncbi:hypothetical protein [uncultured Christiangramia sp.]|uniref:hypothetical protein n=1 Tax=Christiangramia sp. 3-2217-3z TaxID=3417564 RepID=UPI002609023D|nr:hypothetical protein [uncultured Christiangramia sp.]
MILVITLFVFVRSVLELPLLQSLSYSTVKNIFDSLSSNVLPEEDKIENSYTDFLTFISALWLLSGVFGMLAYLINAKIFNLFKYNNYWENVLKGTYKKKKEDNNLVYGFTEADVLVDTNNDSKLYSGKVIDYFLSQKDNQLETIVLSGVKRYKKIFNEEGKHISTEPRFVPGDNFCIGNDKILNLNLTYVYEDKSENILYKRLRVLVDITYVLGLLALVLILYLDLDWALVSTVTKKFIFFILSWLILDNFLRLMKVIINGQTKNLKLENLLVYVIFIIPYLWLLNIIEWWGIIIFEIVAFMIVGFILNPNRKKNR